jgi:hypothetical protein
MDHFCFGPVDAGCCDGAGAGVAAGGVPPAGTLGTPRDVQYAGLFGLSWFAWLSRSAFDRSLM